MNLAEREQLSELLKGIAAQLDIPDDAYEDATLKYEDVGAWLAAVDSELVDYAPEIYPQGSFRLGTVVRPISKEDEYDIDLVCHLKLGKEKTTQKDLKQMVGDRLKKREDLAKILESMRRSWRLGYPSENLMPHFHLDILPALPNPERLPTGILLTDTELTRWQKSNPKAYADWFYDRMRTVFLERRAILAKSLEETVEEVPEWQVRTPLQIAVQILKRHRDIFFQDNLDDKPPSIIITTLTASVYNNQANVYDALVDIVREMPTKIECRNGKWWIENPVEPDENFADKWNEYPERRENFMAWLKKVQDDFSHIDETQILGGTVDLLESVLGKRAVAIPAANLGLKSLESLPTVFSPVPQVPAIGNTSHCQRPDWLEQLRYKVTVSGSIHRKKAHKKLWDLTSRSVPKEVWLKFHVKTNTPPPYDVKWQVVNTGKEAYEAQQLRGEFYPSEESNLNVRWESTAYKGTHWVEAFILKDGVCVARSGRKMVRVR